MHHMFKQRKINSIKILYDSKEQLSNRRSKWFCGVVSHGSLTIVYILQNIIQSDHLKLHSLEQYKAGL